uniref:Uncharacterized protein n=1 Tax=Pseudictyota dubia TaxID=2749911 RepID=A0A7R9WAB3_9STRA
MKYDGFRMPSYATAFVPFVHVRSPHCPLQGNVRESPVIFMSSLFDTMRSTFIVRLSSVISVRQYRLQDAIPRNATLESGVQTAYAAADSRVVQPRRPTATNSTERMCILSSPSGRSGRN